MEEEMFCWESCVCVEVSHDAWSINTKPMNFSCVLSLFLFLCEDLTGDNTANSEFFHSLVSFVSVLYFLYPSFFSLAAFYFLKSIKKRSFYYLTFGINVSADQITSWRKLVTQHNWGPIDYKLDLEIPFYAIMDRVIHLTFVPVFRKPDLIILIQVHTFSDDQIWIISALPKS